MQFDYALVGGGLANGLIALALAERRPEARVLLIDESGTLGGNHTWSFFDSDLPPGAAELLAPLVVARWHATEVRFPGFGRTLEGGYASISSARFDRVIRHRFGDRILRARVSWISPGEVRLDDGRRIQAKLVIDARGPERAAPAPGGFQKFAGLELMLRPHSFVPGSGRAMVMDATVAQLDGFRFMYVLPLAPGRVLVEDTVYSDDPTLEADGFEARVLAYAEKIGLEVVGVARRERGVLPLPFSPPSIPAVAPGLLVAGVQGGWFHPVTGYSIAVAARVAAGVAATPPEEFPPPRWEAFTAEHLRQARLGCRLNRLLFRATRPEERWRVLARFYRLPAETIARFYAMDTTLADRLRIFVGRPPVGVSFWSAVAQWSES